MLLMALLCFFVLESYCVLLERLLLYLVLVM